MKLMLALPLSLLCFPILSLSSRVETSGDPSDAVSPTSARVAANTASEECALGTISFDAASISHHAPRLRAVVPSAFAPTYVACNTSTWIYVGGDTLYVTGGFATFQEAKDWTQTEEAPLALLETLEDALDVYFADYECTGCWNGTPGCEGSMSYDLENGQAQYRIAMAPDGRWFVEILFRNGEKATMTCSPCD